MLPIKVANVRRQECKKKIEELEKMIELFDEEFNMFVRSRQEKSAFQERVLKYKITQYPTVEEMVKKIEEKAQEKHPIPRLNERE